MSGAGEARRRVQDAVARARTLPSALPGVVAIALVGSWARDMANAESDVDLILLTEQPAIALNWSGWVSAFGDDVEIVRTADFGAIQERRLRLPNGLIVEVGIGSPSWAATCPVDAGTDRVARDGLVPLHDPHGLLGALLDAIGVP